VQVYSKLCSSRINCPPTLLSLKESFFNKKQLLM
jgi:hypothetical protein